MNDIAKFLEDMRVPIVTKGSTVTRGWIGLNCPFCGDNRFHMGYNTRNNIFSCFRCGIKPFFKTLILLTGKTRKEIEEILPSYFVAQEETEAKVSRPHHLELPREFDRITSRHKRYLKSRNFDWRQIEDIWGVLGTGDEGEYANRLVIPIFYQRKMVSFTCRDITGKSNVKTMICPRDKEVIPSRNLLHGFDLVKGNSVIVTEGPFDSFRFGPGAVDTQGIQFTESQIEMLGAFKNIFICFDSILNDNGRELEKKAQEQAEKLADCLSINCNVWIIDQFKKDPADMSDRQIRHIKNKIQRILNEREKDV